MHGRRQRAEGLEEDKRHREGGQQLAREAFALDGKRVGVQEKRIRLQDEHGKVELVEKDWHEVGNAPVQGARVVRCDVEGSAEHADSQVEDEADAKQRAHSEARAVDHGDDAHEHQRCDRIVIVGPHSVFPSALQSHHYSTAESSAVYLCTSQSHRGPTRGREERRWGRGVPPFQNDTIPTAPRVSYSAVKEMW